MEKTEFTEWLCRHFKQMLSTAEKWVAREIEGRESRTDVTSFREWLRTEHERAANDPSLAKFDIALREAYSTPEGAAQSLTNLINAEVTHSFDSAEQVIDWNKQFTKAAALLSNPDLTGAKNWKYRGMFCLYVKAAKADIRAKVFARHIEAGRKTGLQLFPAFVGLFLDDEKAHRALKAAMIAGIIDETGKSKLGLDRKIIPAIVQFWEAVSDHKFELTHIRAKKEAISETYLQQCEAIAEQFGATISPKTVYSRAGERAGKFFSAVFAALERQ